MSLGNNQYMKKKVKDREKKYLRLKREQNSK